MELVLLEQGQQVFIRHRLQAAENISDLLIDQCLEILQAARTTKQLAKPCIG